MKQKCKTFKLASTCVLHPKYGNTTAIVYPTYHNESIYKFDEISNDNELFTTVYLQGKICALVMIADSRIIG